MSLLGFKCMILKAPCSFQGNTLLMSRVRFSGNNIIGDKKYHTESLLYLLYFILQTETKERMHSKRAFSPAIKIQKIGDCCSLRESKCRLPGVIHTEAGHLRIRHPNFHPSPTLSSVTPLSTSSVTKHRIRPTQNQHKSKTNPSTLVP